jgi:SAM-dependent methyltransferase
MPEAPSVSADNPAKFDAYARDYRALHQRSIGTSGEDPEYFARYKLDCLRRVGAESPVLDYGCGIGNLTVHLGASFGEVHGSDPSRESLEAAKERVPTVQFWGPGESAPAGHFGTVVVSGVLHHIAPPERLSALQEIYSKLRPGGQLVVFEHNPLNPLTQKAVRDCPFDDDAILLWPKELKGRLRAAGFEQIQLSYIVFFPRFLARLRPLEPHLGWLCAGAQTMTLARRPR